MATLIDADPCVALAVAKGVLIQSPDHGLDPFLNITFLCANNNGKGFGKAWATIEHDTEGNDYTSTALALATVTGTGIQGNVVNEDNDLIPTAYAIVRGTPWVGPPIAVGAISNSFVKWADKNGLFTLSTTTENKINLAGERPMPFGDVLYQAKKIGDKMAIYGKNGVAIMFASGLFWGVDELLPIGIRSKNAVCGNDKIHYFLDREYILWELTADGGLKPHDYSNHLSVMGVKTVLTFDDRKKIVYICDGTYGFIFSQSGLGKGPATITGMGYRGGTFYVVAPAVITNTAITVWTDIWDGGSREDKEIMSIGLATDVAQPLYGSIAYRWNTQESFYTTPWVKADRGGVVYVTASGIEFKFGMKLKTYASMRLDRMDVEVTFSELKPLAGARA